MLHATLGAAPRLRLITSDARPEGSSSRWFVTGWPATVTTWTAAEWAALDDLERPPDAQPHGDGWCLLRIA